MILDSTRGRMILDADQGRDLCLELTHCCVAWQECAEDLDEAEGLLMSVELELSSPAREGGRLGRQMSSSLSDALNGITGSLVALQTGTIAALAGSDLDQDGRARRKQLNKRYTSIRRCPTHIGHSRNLPFLPASLQA